MPKPNKGESQSEFISRGMRHGHIKKEFDSIDQRLAILYSIWRKHRGGKKPNP